jgi:hypothetical protein
MLQCRSKASRRQLYLQVHSFQHGLSAVHCCVRCAAYFGHFLCCCEYNQYILAVDGWVGFNRWVGINMGRMGPTTGPMQVCGVWCSEGLPVVLHVVRCHKGYVCFEFGVQTPCKTHRGLQDRRFACMVFPVLCVCVRWSGWMAANMQLYTFTLGFVVFLMGCCS